MTDPFIDPQTVHDPSVVNTPTVAWANSVRDGVVFGAKPPTLQAWTTTAKSITASTYTSGFNDTAEFTTTVVDTDGFLDLSGGANDEIIIPTGHGGTYMITWACDWDAATSGTATRSQLALNGFGVSWTCTPLSYSLGSGTVVGDQGNVMMTLSVGTVITIEVSSSVTKNLAGAYVGMYMVRPS